MLTAASFSLLFAKWKEKKVSSILFPKPLWWIATGCAWVTEVVCFGVFVLFLTREGSVLHWTCCLCIHVAVRGRPAGAGPLSTTWDSGIQLTFLRLSSRCLYTLGQLPSPRTCLFNEKVGARSDSHFVTHSGWFWTHPLPASDSQALKLQVDTSPSLIAVISFFQNVATSHGPSHGLWLACLLRCKMKRHTCSKAHSSNYGSCCQGQQEKQEMLQ